MICLDCNAAVAAFQKDPPPNAGIHRARVHAFLKLHHDLRLMFPTVALSEYLWKADQEELTRGILDVTSERLFAPPFDELTAQIAADLGRRYCSEGRSLGQVAKDTGHDRVALKADLLIIASALQHTAQHFLTADPRCKAVAEFAGLNAKHLTELPDPPPPEPPPSPSRPPGYNQGKMFDT